MHVECAERGRDFRRRMRPLLGTFVEIGFGPAPGDELAVQEAFSTIDGLQRSLSFQNPDSELSRLNRSHGRFIALSPVAVVVLRLARAMMLASGGLFNCTLGGLLVRQGVLPDHGDREPLDVGTAADIEIANGGARLLRDIRVTLDGLAKGYAVDQAMRALKRGGLGDGWVNAGGDLRVFGQVTLPVHRREPDGTLRYLGGLREAAIATSLVQPGTEGRFPGRILRADGGRPAPGVCTVLARQAWRADALTKVATLAATSTREQLLARLGGRLVEPRPRMG
jgi:thiamine biosynthesis lipoprotein